jgi:hypothetical protein
MEIHDSGTIITIVIMVPMHVSLGWMHGSCTIVIMEMHA